MWAEGGGPHSHLPMPCRSHAVGGTAQDLQLINRYNSHAPKHVSFCAFAWAYMHTQGYGDQPQPPNAVWGIPIAPMATQVRVCARAGPGP